MIIDPVISGFITNEVRSYLNICDNLIINIEKRGFCLGFSNTSHVDILDRFMKVALQKFHNDIYILKKKMSSIRSKEIRLCQ